MTELIYKLLSLHIKVSIYKTMLENGAWVDFLNSEDTIKELNGYSIIDDVKTYLVHIKTDYIEEKYSIIDCIDDVMLFDVYCDVISNEQTFKYRLIFNPHNSVDYDVLYSYAKDRLASRAYQYINNECFDSQGNSYDIQLDNIIKTIEKI